MEHDAASKPLAAVKSSLAYGEIRLSLLKEGNNDVSGHGNGAVMGFIVFKSDFVCNKWTGFLARGTSCTKLQCGRFIWKLVVSPQKDWEGEAEGGLSEFSVEHTKCQWQSRAPAAKRGKAWP